MIEFKKVTATYREDVGVFDISFKIDPGEMVFLMGPTGAGKSTVLKAIYRAIETRRPVIRCANTGISMIVNPYGNILRELGLNKQGVIDEKIVLSDKKTFYTKYGDIFSILNLILLILLFLNTRRKGNF